MIEFSKYITKEPKELIEKLEDLPCNIDLTQKNYNKVKEVKNDKISNFC